jgi:hypothetical protein
MVVTWLPETCWATSRREIKNTKVTSIWFFLSTYFFLFNVVISLISTSLFRSLLWLCILLNYPPPPTPPIFRRNSQHCNARGMSFLVFTKNKNVKTQKWVLLPKPCRPHWNVANMLCISDGKFWRKPFIAYTFHLLACEQRRQMCTLPFNTNMWNLVNVRWKFYHNAYTLSSFSFYIIFLLLVKL